MAVDYTKLFTIIGCYGDNIDDRYAAIAAYTTEQSAVEDILVAQSVERLIDGLDSVYDVWRQNAASDVQLLIDRVADVLTDEPLVTSQFGFGGNVGIQNVLSRLISDMWVTDKNVAASVVTVGSITKTCVHANAGSLMIGTLLDGVTPPVSGGIAIRKYAGYETQMIPDSETITVTCVSDSGTGSSLGAEQFRVTGTGGQSNAFDVTGENIGETSLTVGDQASTGYVINGSLDQWTSVGPTGWTVDDGAIDVEFEQTTGLVDSANGYALKTLGTDTDFRIFQVLNPTTFTRGRAFFFSCVARKATDVASDLEIALEVTHEGGGTGVRTMNIQPTSTTPQVFYDQFIVPFEILDDLLLSLVGNLDSDCDDIIIDQITIQPCTYIAGVAIGLVQGADKFLVGDQFSLTISNNNAGKFQTLFRKAFKVQLPTDATPTISDSLFT